MLKLFSVAALCLMLSGGMAAQAPVELKVGDQAPVFALPGTDGQVHRLSDYAGRAVVLAWYPKASTTGWQRWHPNARSPPRSATPARWRWRTKGAWSRPSASWAWPVPS